MSMWKAEAFDDYLWNVSQFVYPPIEGNYDLVLCPTPSQEESSGHVIDEFFTVQLFKAKRDNTPICGIEILPVQFIPNLFPKIFDYFFIKTQEGKQFLVDKFKINSSKVFVSTYKPDTYTMNSIEDVYEHYLFKTVQPPRNELNVLLMNHVQQRDEMKDAVKALSELPVKVNLIFGLINYAVKELHENEIIKELLMPDFGKYFKEIKFVDVREIPQMLISMDAFISMNYMTLFNWCKKYNIPCVVYDNPTNFKKELTAIWAFKKEQIGLSNVIGQINNLILEREERKNGKV